MAATRKGSSKKKATKKAAAKKKTTKKTAAKKKATKKAASGAKKKAAGRKATGKKAAAGKRAAADPGPQAPSLPRREAGAPGFGISPHYLAALPEYEKGMELLQQREFAQAEAQFKSLISSYPNVRELVDRARTYLALCQKQQAETRELVGFEDFYHHGVYLSNRGDYAEALEHLEKALELQPESAKVLYTIASVHSLQGERDAALQALRWAIDLDDSIRIYAKNDPDFQRLHSDPDFTQLVGLAEAQSAG